MHSYTVVNFSLREEYLAALKEKKAEEMKYPRNVNLRDYLYYAMTPSLVYELEYPQSKETFRLNYFLTKLFFALVLIVTVYLILCDIWIPLCDDFVSGKIVGILELYMRLVSPFCAAFFLLFLIIFEYVCNCYAELTRFGDRLFYQDFWNCTTYDEFSRKWNRIVHEFLYRHFYLAMIRKGYSPGKSYIVTLLYSAFFHEYFIICTLKIYRPYMIIMMFSQITMTFLYVGLFRLKRGSIIGNLMYWLAQLFGQNYLVILYTVDYLDVTK
eukprot:TRINITY_DN395_c0_g5_i2.p1 TRINITY_DN395_c0_g5~~TRINITY_DN395_c0_g5_i2.p1  ORF type:complete len:269 (+),score=56.80 TRINITY_DN395_c0_g5_i2:612-1418(+)